MEETTSLLNKNLKILIIVLAISSFILAAFPRFIDVDKYLPFYSLDENEVVEYSVAMMGEDKYPHWRKYGPLNWYVLSYVYKVQASLSDNYDEFVEKVFFDRNEFYITARVLNAIFNIGMAVFAFFMARRFISKDVAWLSLALLAFPFSDWLAYFYVRVDTLQGFCTIAGLFFLLNYFKTKKLHWAGIAGVFVGLSIASKPLPGLLSLPTVGLSFLVYNMFGENGKGYIKLPEAIKASFKSPAPYIALAGVFLGNFIGNPYSILDWDAFYAEQLQVIKDDGSYNWPEGYKVSKFYTNLGVVFVWFSIIALTLTFFKKFRNVFYFIILSFPLVYFMIFINKPTRLYFYIPIIPYLILAMAIFVKEYINKLPKPLLFILFFGVLAQPSYRLMNSVKLKRTNDLTAHTGIVATKWFEENVPDGAKVLYYGYYTSLPKVVDKNPQNFANNGDFFMYFRYNYDFLKSHLENAHKKYIEKGGIAYNITSVRYDLKHQEPGLYNYCMQNKIQYVVTPPNAKGEYNLNKYPEFSSKLVKYFTNKDKKTPVGNDIYIYKLF